MASRINAVVRCVVALEAYGEVLLNYAFIDREIQNFAAIIRCRVERFIFFFLIFFLTISGSNVARYGLYFR